MKNKISEIGAIYMALLYRKKYADSEMIKLSSAKKFKETIESNLQSMHSEYSWCTNYKEENDLYFICRDENNILYAIIDPSANIQRATEHYIYCLPTDIIQASLMNNALEIIGLKEENNKIVEIRDEKLDNELEKVINQNIKYPNNFYKEVFYSLSLEERDFLKQQFTNKSCFNCINGLCKLPYKEKGDKGCCIDWQNPSELGKKYILKKKS